MMLIWVNLVKHHSLWFNSSLFVLFSETSWYVMGLRGHGQKGNICCIGPYLNTYFTSDHISKCYAIDLYMCPLLWASCQLSVDLCTIYHDWFNTLRPRQNGRHFAADISKCIFLNENDWISIKISLKFIPRGPINYIAALVQIMAWRRPGDKPLSEPMMIILLTHICVTRPQWVNGHEKMCKKILLHHCKQ